MAYNSCYVYSSDVLTFGGGQPGRQNLLPQRDMLAEFMREAEHNTGVSVCAAHTETKCSYCRMPSTKSLCPTCGAPKA